MKQFAKSLVRPFYRRLRVAQLLRQADVLTNPGKWYSDMPPDFLIVGMQKAGTYWLTALLDRHPEVTSFPSLPGGAAGVGEGHFFDILGEIDSNRERFCRSFTFKHDGFFRDLVPLVDKVDRQKLLDLYRRRYNAFVQRQSTKRIVGDKTAEYVFQLDLIDQLYPGIKKICILRDPRDRVVSFHFHQLRKGRINNHHVEDSEVEDYAQRVHTELSILLRYQGNIKLLTYEALSQQPEAVTTDLLDYLEVITDEHIVKDMVKGASFESLSGRKRGESDLSSHFRKGAVGDGSNSLEKHQLELLHQRLDPMTEDLASKTGLDLASYLKPVVVV